MESDRVLRARAQNNKILDVGEGGKEFSDIESMDEGSSEGGDDMSEGSESSQDSFTINTQDYDWELINETHNHRFQAAERMYHLNLRREYRGEVRDMLKVIGDILNRFLDLTKQDMEPTDFTRFVIISPELRDPIAIPWVLVRDLDVEAILNLIERVLQSNQHFYLHNGVTFVLKHIHNPIGAGFKRHKEPFNNDEYVWFKKTIIQVRNKDNMCFGRAIIKALHTEHGPVEHPKWKSIQNENHILTVLTRKLYQEAGVPEGKVSALDVPKFQEVLARRYNVRLMIYSRRFANGYTYKGPDLVDSIYLYHYEDHYAVITSMPAFVKLNKFCNLCLKGYNKKDEHACEGICMQCKTSECDAKLSQEFDKSKWLKCDKCWRDFKTKTCYDKHMENETCENHFICKKCSQYVNMNRLPEGKSTHECGDHYCSLCMVYVNKDHQCYMQPSPPPDSTGTPLPEKYVFYDFECQQNTGIHKPNLVVARWTCTNCVDLPLDTPDRETKLNECKICEQKVNDREVVFEGESTVSKFCTWLFKPRPNQRETDLKGNEKLIYRTTAVAHNSQGYDIHFIMENMIHNGIQPDAVIRRGGKVLHMTRNASNIRFIDSLSFLAMPLSKFPSTFDLPSVKGYFPHYFNVPGNENYRGPLPAPEFYGVDRMMAKARNELLQWHREQTSKGTIFDFQEEILKYCRLDVDILEKGCLEFRKLFMSLTSSKHYKGIDPLKHCVTLPSACNLVFRTLFLKPNVIPLLPHKGFTPKKPQSRKALRWLHLQSKDLNCNIEHEVKVAGYYTDGYCRDTNTVFEFYGCAVHGCLSCYTTNCQSPFSKKSMGQLYQETRGRMDHIKTSDTKPNVVEIWECEFDNLIKRDKAVADIVNQANVAPILAPREAFFGGRCNGLKMYHTCLANERIMYVDFTSLYPWVNKTARYPIGHPEVIRSNFKSIDDYFGLIQCVVLPPSDLYIPLLPSKPDDGKLTFALCYTCAKNHQQTPCRHGDKARMFRGVWFSEELKKAVQLGYKIVKFEEVWHFKDSTVYDPQTKTGGIFAEYINTFLKVKQESSGWPAGVTTDAEQAKYIRDYYEVEGIRLEREKIKHNPGLRAVSKSILNTLWGKFGQSEDLVKTEYFSSPSEVLNLLSSTKIEVNDLTFHNEYLCEAQYKYMDSFKQKNPHTNVVLAAVTTAYARLKLYSVMEALEDDSVLYFDTDSIVYIDREGEYSPPIGNNLGELTNEINPKDGNFIKTFLTGGPKNYCYALDTGKTVCKVRGITLNHETSKIINFDTLNEMLKPNSELEKVTVPLKDKITRDTKTKQIVNKNTHKDYRVVYTKRVRQENGIDTLPYGYRK